MTLISQVNLKNKSRYKKVKTLVRQVKTFVCNYVPCTEQFVVSVFGFLATTLIIPVQLIEVNMLKIKKI